MAAATTLAILATFMNPSPSWAGLNTLANLPESKKNPDGEMPSGPSYSQERAFVGLLIINDYAFSSPRT